MTETTAAIDSTASAGSWLTVQEAMLRLGISERTLFRRLARGRLRKRTRDDGKIEVWVTSESTVSAGGSVEAGTPAGSAAGSNRIAPHDARDDGGSRALLLLEQFGELVTRQMTPVMGELSGMRQQLIAMAEENGRLKAQVQELERRLAEANASARFDRAAAVPSPQRRRWWAPWRYERRSSL